MDIRFALWLGRTGTLNQKIILQPGLKRRRKRVKAK